MEPNQQNKHEPYRTRDLEIKSKRRVTRREGGRGSWGKEGEGASKGTQIEASWAQTLREIGGAE